MTDDRGVLGNLPSSRPGRRSSKRPAQPRAQASTTSERRRPPKPADPVGDAIRTAVGVAATGARVAGGIGRELVRRLPRP